MKMLFAIDRDPGHEKTRAEQIETYTWKGGFLGNTIVITHQNESEHICEQSFPDTDLIEMGQTHHHGDR